MNHAPMPTSFSDGAPSPGPVTARRASSLIGMWCALLLSVSACSHSLSQPPDCGVNGQNAAQPSLRLLVSFRVDTVGDALEVVEQLQYRAKACVRFVSSVSPTLHVYSVVGGADAQTVRTKWLQWPAVARVDVDERMDKQ
jgi:hypothetical protein